MPSYGRGYQRGGSPVSSGAAAGVTAGWARLRAVPVQTATCKPIAPPTIKQIHAILSGTFGAAVRWEWIDRNPAASAKLPKMLPRTPSSPEPEQVAKVIAAVRDLGLDLLAGWPP